MPFANRLLFKRPLPEKSDEPLVKIDRLTAIDIGTNSIHAVIVDIFSDRSFRMVDMLKEQVGFGAQGMNRHLPADAMANALEALKKVKMLSDRRESVHITAYATSAVRESINGGAFIQTVLDETGIKILAIPGLKEAELIAMAVRKAVSIGPEPVLMMDIGGGSTEFILADERMNLFMDSFKLGGSRLYAGFVKSEPLSREDKTTLKNHFREEMVRMDAVLTGKKIDRLVVSSGTMESALNLIAKRRSLDAAPVSNGFTASAVELAELYRDVQLLNREQRLKLPGIDEKRADALIPGLVLAQYVVKKYAIEKIEFSSFALREGMMIEHINRLFNDEVQPGEFIDLRHQSVFELLKRCQWHEKHSVQVSRIALKLFDDLQAFHGMDGKMRELLKFACLMHDIGYHISQRKHHLHALYLIFNADLKGFLPDEIAITANVARYHRKSIPKERHENFEKLKPELKTAVLKLSAFMRVADGLDRSHYQNVQAVQAVMTAKSVEIHLVTTSDPQLEIWGAKRKSELFESLFQRKVKFRQVPVLESVHNLSQIN